MTASRKTTFTVAQLALLALGAAACQPSEGVGGLTADIIFGPAPLPGQQSLRAAAVPAEVGRLEIRALDAAGSTLAVTILALEPGPDELPLAPEGGTWTLDEVPVGTGRVLSGAAFIRADLAPGAVDVVAYAGRIQNIEVRADEITEAGPLALLPTPNRVPEADFEAPGAPNPVAANPLPEGEAVRVTFAPLAEDTDVAGYVLAVATSSAASAPPTIDRGTPVAPGDRLAAGVRVHSVGPLAGPTIVTVEDLEDNVPVGMLVYAFDADRAGAPLNFSAPAQALALPTDSAPPGAPTGLRAASVGPGRVQIEFIAPAEDGAEGGAPARYQLRASADRAPLDDPARFATLDAAEPPPVAAPGTSVIVERSLAELGATPGVSFFVGLRAEDAAANVGPIAVAEVVLNATVAPSLTAVAPPIGLAGRELVITGAGFGTVTGTVTIVPTETGTVTAQLVVSRWTDGQIIAAVPVNARTGRLTVTRPDGQRVDAPLSVIAIAPNQVEDFEYPFEVVGTGDDAPAKYALYREDGEFTQRDSAIDRYFGAQSEGTPWAPAIEQDQSTWITGTYSQSHDRFMFIASNEALSMTSALVTSSTITPDPHRLLVGVTAGGADRVSVLITEGGVGAAVPAMVAFTINGVIRTATVADARFQPFDGFYATTSTVQTYEAVTLARDRDGAVLMAHRTVTGTVAVLSLRDNPAGVAPNAFTPRVLASPPRLGERFELLSAPTTPAGPERFVVVYMHAPPGGAGHIRAAFADDLGTSVGLAPFDTPGLRLDDAGLVIREGQVYIAIAATLRGASAELRYTELPLSALSTPAASDGGWPGVVVDIAEDDHYARIGCKPYLQATCPIFWLGDNAGVLFLRR